MARMFPSMPPPDANKTERRLRQYFESLPEDWIVFHGQMVTSGGPRVRESEVEIDFIVVNPKKGYVCLEVKGGRLQKNQAGWKQNGRSIRNPVVQAKTERSVLRNHLHKKRWAWADCCNWGLIFPDVSANADIFSAELPKQHLIDGQLLAHIERIILDLLHPLSAKKPAQAMTEEETRVLLDELYPMFDLVPGLKDELSDERQQIIKLTLQQKDLITALSGQKKVYVLGRAGTGKTIVALEFAKSRIEEGLKVLYLCFNDDLAEEIKGNVKGLDVFSFHKLSQELCQKAGIPWKIPVNKAAKDKDRFFKDESHELLLEASSKLVEEKWDAVIIDEAHDFEEDWMVPIKDLLRDRRKSFLWAFLDPLQDIFQRGQHFERENLRPYKLMRNCRNTKEIAEYSYDFVEKKPEMYPDSPVGAEVETHTYGSPEEQMEIIQELLEQFIVKEKIEKKDIVILSGRSHKTSAVWVQRERLSGGFELTQSRSPKQRRKKIYFTSIWKFKGLDANIVIMCDVHSGISNEAMYTGTSRAKHRLHVLQEN